MGDRCMVYVDGYNFYYAIKRHPEMTPLYLGWCNFAELARQSLLASGDQLIGVKYFTAPVGRYGASGGPAGSENARQEIWLKAIHSVPEIEIVEGVHTGDVGSPRSRKEKETDVNIAISAVIDGSRDQYDRAILLTGDRDQRPTVRAIVTEFGKRVDVWLAPSQSRGFWSTTEAYGGVRVRSLTPTMLRRSRLPERLFVNGGQIEAPQIWQAPK